MNCNWIPFEKGQDKICHFGVGFIVAMVLSIAIAPIWGLIGGVILGLGKEAYDEYQYAGADFFDLFATVAGVTFAIFLYGLIEGTNFALIYKLIEGLL